MDMSFGKYKGKPVAWVLIEHFDYFTWMKDKQMCNYNEFQFFIELLNTLDSLPFKVTCCHCHKNTVTSLSLYKGNYNGHYWFCDDCDPYSMGAASGNLTMIHQITKAPFIDDMLIKAFYLAKGGPQRKTKKSLKDFFGY